MSSSTHSLPISAKKTTTDWLRLPRRLHTQRNNEMGVRDPGSSPLDGGLGPQAWTARLFYKGATMAELTVGGTSYTLAPLRLSQVFKVIPGVDDVKLDSVEGILRAVAYSLMNAGAFEGQSVEVIANTVDVHASSGDVQQAYLAIMAMTGLQKLPWTAV
jgi:hypothetical protein